MKKIKFASAEQKRNYQELKNSWEKIKLKHQSTRTVPVKNSSVENNVSPKMTAVRGTTNVSSLVTTGGSCGKKKTIYYTGEKIIGIATIHKSCLQPIFNKQSAVDVAHMRR